jgi:hypothetical protein
LPRRVWALRQHGIRAHVDPFIAALPIAAACVALSRVAHFQPGYFYGAIAGLVFLRELPEDEEGPIAAINIGWTIAMAVAAWIWRSKVHGTATAADAPMWSLIADGALSAVVVGGIEGTVMKLLPLRVFDGSAIKRWSPRVWLAMYAASLLTFVCVLLNPDSGYVARGSDAAIAWSYTIFGAFGALSIGIWARMRRRDHTPGAAPLVDPSL